MCACFFKSLFFSSSCIDCRRKSIGHHSVSHSHENIRVSPMILSSIYFNGSLIREPTLRGGRQQKSPTALQKSPIRRKRALYLYKRALNFRERALHSAHEPYVCAKRALPLLRVCACARACLRFCACLPVCVYGCVFIICVCVCL